MVHEKRRLQAEPSAETARKLKDMLRIYDKICQQLGTGMPLESPILEESAPEDSLSWEMARKAMQQAKDGKTEAISEWLSRGGSLDTSFILGETMLMQATTFGHRNVIEYLLEHGADINHRNILGENALVHSARFGHLDIFKLLLQRGIDFPQSGDMLGRSMCMFAAIGGNGDIFKECLKRGGNDSLQDGNGVNMLMYAIMGKNPMLLHLVMQLPPYSELGEGDQAISLSKAQIETLSY